MGRSGTLLGSVFGRTDFSRILIFEPPDLVAGFFLLIFVGKSAQKNPPGKSPTKSTKFYTTKIPDNFLQRDQGKLCGLSTCREAYIKKWRAMDNVKCEPHSDLAQHW